MICPNEGNKFFDEQNCIYCQWYQQCYKAEQSGNIFGTDEALGDNFPNISDCPADKGEICNKGKACDSCKDNKITNEEVEKFKIELSNIIFYSEWEKKYEN